MYQFNFYKKYMKEIKTKKINKNKKNKTNKLSQNTVAKLLKPITSTQINNEYKKLQSLRCSEIQKFSARTTLGNNVVDFFTFSERLHTKGKQNISFYDFWKNKKKISKLSYVKKMLEFYKTRNIEEIRKYKYIYNLYFSSISIFRPLMAMEIYCKVKAKRILDFTMGWGGRLVGACALSLDAYYGIDSNTNLEKPYKYMTDFLKKKENYKTDVKLFFTDALKVDYSKFDYDTVFTSPPYYELEKYRKMRLFDTDLEWENNFYKPLFQKTFDYLKPGGAYCLNVPEIIYNNVCLSLFGPCKNKILLKKANRNIGKYKEYVYIWYK